MQFVNPLEFEISEIIFSVHIMLTLFFSIYVGVDDT